MVIPNLGKRSLRKHQIHQWEGQVITWCKRIKINQKIKLQGKDEKPTFLFSVFLVWFILLFNFFKIQSWEVVEKICYKSQIQLWIAIHDILKTIIQNLRQSKHWKRYIKKVINRQLIESFLYKNKLNNLADLGSQKFSHFNLVSIGKENLSTSRQIGDLEGNK